MQVVPHRRKRFLPSEGALDFHEIVETFGRANHVGQVVVKDADARL